MTHEAYVYLLYKAHLLWSLQKKAAEKGQTFHPSNHFDEVGDGLEAQARIYRPREDAPIELALCLRYAAKSEVPLRVVNEAAHQFFGDAPFREIEPATLDGRIHHVFFSAEVPKSVIPLE